MARSPQIFGLAFCCLPAVHALASGANVSPLVINEVFIHPSEVCGNPTPGPEKFVEIQNTSTQPVDTLNWWICDHPFSHYWRILQVPQDNGPPASESILLQPGDFLVVRFHGQFPPPNGDYTTRPNNSGTTTHILRIFIPESALACFLRPTGNFSIWDHSPPSDPDFPSFDVPFAIRDYIAWGPSGTQTGWQRGCIASHPQAELWPLPIQNDCTGSQAPVFPAVNTAPLLDNPNNSINYNGGDTDSGADYFLAPATEGERNVMPGDLDTDLDMDNDDYNAFVACLNLPADPPTCSLADFNQDLVVDCLDWPAFVAHWQQYSTLPGPQSPCIPCTPGDFDDDGLITGNDIQGFVTQITNNAPSCAADIDGDGDFDCEDLHGFSLALLAAPVDCLKGDINFDGLIDGADIQPFLTILLSPPTCPAPTETCVADINADEAVTIEDLESIVPLLLGPPK